MSMDAYCRLVQRELFGFGKDVEEDKGVTAAGKYGLRTSIDRLCA